MFTIKSKHRMLLLWIRCLVLRSKVKSIVYWCTTQHFKSHFLPQWPTFDMKTLRRSHAIFLINKKYLPTSSCRTIIPTYQTMATKDNNNDQATHFGDHCFHLKKVPIL